MKNSTSQYLYSVLRQAAQEFRQFGQKVTQALSRTALPKVLVVLIALFMVIVLIPLLISLFVFVVLLRIVLAILLPGKKQGTSKTINIVHIAVFGSFNW